MKKPLILCGLILMTPMSYAASWSMKANAGMWQPDYNGDLSTTRLHDLGYSNKSNTYFHLALEHPAPFVPNFRASYISIRSEKKTPLETSTIGPVMPALSVNDNNIVNVPAAINTNIDLTHIDATAYYTVLNSWLKFDLGLSLRQFKGEIRTNSPQSNNVMLPTSRRIALNDTLPMVYILAEADLPLTGWSLVGEGKYTGYKDYNISDYSLSLRYLFNAVLDFGAEVGYRTLHVDLDKSFDAHIELAGPYAGFVFQF